MVGAVPERIWGNVAIFQENFRVAHTGVRVPQVRAAAPNAFYLGAKQHHSGLDNILYFVPCAGRSIPCHHFPALVRRADFAFTPLFRL